MKQKNVKLTRKEISGKEDLVSIVDPNFQADQDSETYTQLEKWATKFCQGFEKLEQGKGDKKIPDYKIKNPSTQDIIAIEIKDLQMSSVFDKEEGVYKMDHFKEETKHVDGKTYKRKVHIHHYKTVTKLREAEKQLWESGEKGLQTVVLFGRRFGKLYDYNKVFGLLGWEPIFSALGSRNIRNNNVENKFEGISAVGGFVDTKEVDDPNNVEERLYLIRNPYANVILKDSLPGCLFNPLLFMQPAHKRT